MRRAGRRCEGVHIHLTDTKAYDTIRTGTALLYAIREIYPNDFALRQPEDEKALLPINRLTGSDVLAHDWPDFDALMERWEFCGITRLELDELGISNGQLKRIKAIPHNSNSSLLTKNFPHNQKEPKHDRP